MENVWLVRCMTKILSAHCSVAIMQEMLYDPSVYFNPSQFDPSRFLPDADTAMPRTPENTALDLVEGMQSI